MLQRLRARQKRPSRRAGGLFARSRLRIYGLALAVFYAFFLQGLYRVGAWIIGHDGTPILTDFTAMWLAGREALRGHAASVYDLGNFATVQAAFVGPHKAFFPWPYPPIYFLVLVVFAALPYTEAFLVWQATTLAGCLIVGSVIARDVTAAVLILASPLTLLNLYLGQNGFFTASLTGAALLLLERRPLLAGVSIGCLAYKPQFAVVLPLVLAVSGRWRALAGAAATAATLAVASCLAFGVAAWRAFPAALLKNADTALVEHQLLWGKIQSIYGLGRSVGIGPLAAGGAQAIVAGAAIIATCALWRSRASYELKAAAVSAAALIVSPYLLAYDMAAIVIPAAYLVRDQIARGPLRGERGAVLLLFGGLGAILLTYGNAPLGPFVNLGLFGLIVRRSNARALRPERPTRQ